MGRVRVLISIILTLAASGAPAEPDAAPGAEPDPGAIESEARALMESGDFEAAERRYERLTELVPESFVPHYNLACALARQGDGDAASEALSRAVALGFTDRLALTTDPDLASIRGSAFYDELLGRWGEIVRARRDADLERAVGMMRTQYERRTLEGLRLEIVSAHDPVSTDRAVDELERIARWMRRGVFQGLGRAPLDDQPWVMVILPGERGYARWVLETFGRGALASISSVGGAYEHQQRRLVARDLGATLRHEFVHVLHWRDMTRLKQEHAAWIQEGLAALVEDTDPAPGSALEPAPSWRTNMVKRMLDVGVLPTIRQLAREDLRRFTARRPLAKYAHARTVCMFLLDRGELGAFYDAYIRGFDDDPSGLETLTRVTGLEHEALEEAYRAWVAGLPAVPETGSDLDATIGISVTEGSGDGVKVERVPFDIRREAGIRVGSVITAIDGRPTRDLREFIRVLGTKSPGQTVTLHHRWGRVHDEGEVELEPR